MIPNGIRKDECTGCRACVLSCPTQCIEMCMDADGFLYPQYIDEEKCIQCDLCKNKCHILTDNFNVEQIKGYGFVSKNMELLRNSTSGGFFSLIAKYFIDAGGWVFGSVYDDKFNVITIGSNQFQDVKKMCGSKYVLNDTAHSYNEVKKKLNNNLPVLYCGVPCQIAGLKTYLGKDYEKLFLIDILCHGGPSARLFQTYLKWIENKYDKKVVSYVFRDKKYGRKTIGTIVFDDGEELTVMPSDDPYCSAFYQGKTYRKSCYQCKYACRKRVGDITIGDYWGAEKYHTEINMDNGFSAIIVNNHKGSWLLQLIIKDSILVNTTVERIANNNGILNHPTQYYIYRDEIYKSVCGGKFSFAANKYMYAEARWKTIIKKYIPNNLKIILRRVFK